MSILIKGVNVTEIKRGAVAIVNIDNVVTFVHGDDIVVIPDHGDLADKDAMQKEMIDLYNKRAKDAYMTGSKGVLVDWDDAVAIVKNAPVIIPAERE